ncbi:DnaJ domain-containing protein [Microbacterium sp. NPDC076895]|jgi:hypothetical protein|uniref:DnaJ domain-containing protein n=1 Tax=Microbacterium sp. NPDC076895 TaxID=3154957 RepID=UPI003427B9F7
MATGSAAQVDHYRVLGVDRSATDADIRRAFRGRAREIHPDLNTGIDTAGRFQELEYAYSVLIDPESRRCHDEELSRRDIPDPPADEWAPSQPRPSSARARTVHPQPEPVRPPSASRPDQHPSATRRARRGRSVLGAAVVGLVATAILLPAFLTPAPSVGVATVTEPTPADSPVSTDPYSSCAEVWDALGRPILLTDVGFSPSFDADADAIGCEDDPRTVGVNEASIDWHAVWESAAESTTAFAGAASDALRDIATSLAPATEQLLNDLRQRLGSWWDQGAATTDGTSE